MKDGKILLEQNSSRKKKTSLKYFKINPADALPLRRAFPNCESIRAAGLGFEPRFDAPKAPVLPLDDPAKLP